MNKETEHSEGLSYRDAGVDIDAGNELVERIKPAVKKTMRPEVLTGLGGFVQNLFKDALDDCSGFRPAWRVVRDTGSNQLLERRLATGVGVITTHPDGELGVLGVVDLHRRTRREACAAADTFLLINFE